MSAFELTALFISLVALGGWVNARTLRLPHAVAMLLVGLAGAGVVAGLNAVRPALGAELLKAVESVDFAQAVLGYMDTPMAVSGIAQASGRPTAEVRAERDARVPLKGKMGDGWDTAHAALFLASDDARFISGAILPVDGAMGVRIG